jgi:uncharacterized protein (TIGR00159 family)
MINYLKDIGLIGILDIVFMSLLIYAVIVAFKRTRAAFVLTGILIIACVYLVVRQFNLVMTASVFEMFFAIILIIFVVIFQEEIRHFFEEVAVWSLNRRRMRKQKISITTTEVETLVRSIMDFSKEKIGALIVLRGKNLLDRHLEGEVGLNGELSVPLLKSIFDPHSIGHDGAVIIDGNRVTHFSCHLPLSKNLKKISERGTRHAAALGLSEVTDSLCVVVSEEKGTISIARNGDIQVVENIGELTDILEKFHDEMHPKKKVNPLEDIFKRNSREKVYALLLAIGLWFVLVHGSRIVYKSYVIPISYTEIPAEWKITDIEPESIEVRLRGARTAFYFDIKDRIKFYPNIKIQPGTQEVRVYTNNFILPKGLILEDHEPHYIKVTLSEQSKSIGQPKSKKKKAMSEVK